MIIRLNGGDDYNDTEKERGSGRPWLSDGKGSGVAMPPL